MPSPCKGLMTQSGDPAFIINVSSMEGRFASFKEAVSLIFISH
jgi:hypothetical protein